MAKNIPKPEPSGLSLGDVIYVLAKHKWKIILPTLIALGGAAAYFLKAPLQYESNAQLLVRYVLDRNAVDNVDSTAKPGGERGVDPIMVSQIAILQSRDLARSVVQALKGRREDVATDDASPIEPDPKLLSRISPGSSPATLDVDATTAIMMGVKATAARGSNILDISYKHKDPEVATRVLDLVVKQYLSKHLAIYRSKQAAAEIIAEVQKSETTLRNAESSLLELRVSKEILTLDGAIAAINAELSEARNQLGDAESRLAEQQARVASLLGAATAPKATPVNEAVDTTQSLPEPGAAAATPATAATPAAPAGAAGPAPTTVQRHPLVVDGTLTRYQAVLGRLGALRTENVALLAKYTMDSEAVKLNQSQIAMLESEQSDLETKHPELLAMVRGPAGPGAPVIDLVAEKASLKAAEVRKQKIEERIQSLIQRRNNLIQDAPTIAQAERNAAINEENHKYLMTSKKKAELDQKLNTDNIPNIDIIQAATPALEDVKMRNQIALGIAGGGPAVAAGLVLLFGLLLSPTVKRPAEFENRFGVNVMMAIPYFPHARRLAGPEVPKLTDGSKPAGKGKTEIAPWDGGHAVRPFCEVLRDRLGLYFDLNGIHHKPKMIAVTGATAGAGASTLAGGLAAALSKTGDGKVLLVDMNLGQGSAHPFADGRPASSLDAAVRSPRGLPPTSENLYMAKAESEVPGSHSLGLGRLSRLVPDLMASDFDYIVFDMPPLSSTSPTAAMVGIMDQVMVVVEPEKATRDHLRRSIRDLTDSRAKVSYVFNKTRQHGPAALVEA